MSNVLQYKVKMRGVEAVSKLIVANIYYYF